MAVRLRLLLHIMVAASCTAVGYSTAFKLPLAPARSHTALALACTLLPIAVAASIASIMTAFSVGAALGQPPSSSAAQLYSFHNVLMKVVVSLYTAVAFCMPFLAVGFTFEAIAVVIMIAAAATVVYCVVVAVPSYEDITA